MPFVDEVAGAHVFETALGYCGIAWTEEGVDWLALPEPSRAAARTSLDRYTGGRPLGDPPVAIVQLEDRIRQHFAGDLDDFLDVPLDLQRYSAFSVEVWQALRHVLPGEVVTYGELARRVDRPGGAQAVGRAMATNPVPLIVPCHRVITSAGGLGGFSAGGGVPLKVGMLAIEGVRLAEPPHADTTGTQLSMELPPV